MKFSKYIKDNLYKIIILVLSYLITLLILLAFKVEKEVVVSLFIIYIITTSTLLIIPYLRKRKFYKDLTHNIELIDQAYLVLETINKPDFYEGELLYDALYEINKSYIENINKIKEQLKDFKEYIEMWIHEVKVPLSSLTLISNNHKNKFDKKTKKELKRLENYVEQVLYYARCENAEKDYLIKETDLKEVIKNIGLKNMDDLLENKIDFLVDNVDIKVLTDSKWLEFILGQIINNSIKYTKNIKSSYIKIYTKEEKDKITLNILDNGIGIKPSDLPQVFNKSFTGENGRKYSSSTGMGLYIAKSMCEKLGHTITINSKYNEYTLVSITFAKNKYYDVLK